MFLVSVSIFITIALVLLAFKNLCSLLCLLDVVRDVKTTDCDINLKNSENR